MNLLLRPQLPTMLTLRDRPSLLLDLEERAVTVSAGAGTVAFDAFVAVEQAKNR